MKKGVMLILTILVMLLLFIIGLLLYLIYLQRSVPLSEGSTQTVINQENIPTPPLEKLGEETTPISPTESHEPTITQAPTTPTTADIEGIRQAMAMKHSRNKNDVTVTVSKFDGTHASGGVKFAGDVAGGWFLAAKPGASWVIADDGNGTISCDVIAPYSFSSTMVPECWDEGSQKIIYR